MKSITKQSILIFTHTMDHFEGVTSDCFLHYHPIIKEYIASRL